jgi:hypothetical protein
MLALRALISHAVISFRLQVIAADLERKQADLLRSYQTDIKEVADIFATNKCDPALNKNSAPHSGALQLAAGNGSRLTWISMPYYLLMLRQAVYSLSKAAAGCHTCHVAYLVIIALSLQALWRGCVACWSALRSRWPS